eukprot:CAMPEP_0184699206 /NCGR_PEP_ID=MMETSP0313-20130426/5558_1 /TAXON_ID=2792 /ORGANISM="Porphyridium aerugineum, Strain SAG 1380-2" /LENGTH=467 /DNA_ID=CAMNT_0027158255 /DNA_START=144 /DNA_END=1547 /DNA_ORIENTATION=-
MHSNKLATWVALSAFTVLILTLAVEAGKKKAYKPPKGVIFFDDFESGLGKWTQSKVDKYSAGKFVTEALDAEVYGKNGVEDSMAFMPEKAKHYAMSAPVKVASFDKGFVLQYEVKANKGMTCGGAYLKLPAAPFKDLKKLDDKVPYSIMFGPDRCGSTQKVHLIIQAKDKATGEMREHHLKTPPVPHRGSDQNVHLYRLEIDDAKQEATIQVDDITPQTFTFKDDFEPPFQPPEEIDDPEDKKPEDWIDEAQMKDPNAVKPDDWDEEAPRMIEDEDAKKPDGWMDKEPEMIPDPSAVKPDEWDDEEDGAWEAPVIKNPKCEVGCGAWKRPLKPNPNYKGKWQAPMVDNPDYKGAWAPRKIPNPNYYKLDKVGLLPINAVAIEVWTMDEYVGFDDVLIGTSLEQAVEVADATWAVKRAAEKVVEDEAKKKEDEDRAKAEVEMGGGGSEEAQKVEIDLNDALNQEKEDL